ncbi:acetate--CoA ligase family protein [Mesorhizobium sp. B2-1-5]|uniref:acetate--CoA ligase family protein n=1 Tax=Mesorhizobium sp. B2-1-5 TaxID=2589969 RepID=UPI00112D0B52|nr:acetate--CoA ligase family protein [Mesorhizobium sp. B2-1-5]TPM98491.1 acetate--CoA ligase family protein [Mesorhizobium sp. B2-1-5]
MKPASNDEAKFRSIHAMFNPASIAIVGATEKPGYGGRFLPNLVNTGSSARLYPVNPNRDQIFGVRSYPSVVDLPEAVDLACIVVSSEQVLPAFRQCIERGVKSALIISAGFAELATDQGRARQAELRQLARDSGIRVCGPNCLGLANVAGKSWTTPSTRIGPDMLAFNPTIGLVSQSGATAYRPLLCTAEDKRIGFRYMVATGNEADLESSDFIQYMLRDPEISAVAAVVEGFKDGEKFVETADMAREAGKPLVLLKIGRTEAGARGASSHTASMTGSDDVQDALFRQKGVIRVDDYDELLETAAMFRMKIRPRGKRMGVISESGGMGSFMADKCAEEGLDVPVLSDGVRGQLLEIMGDRGSAANPADLTGFGTGPDFPRVLDILLSDGEQDLVLMSSVGGAMQADTIIEASKQARKPILFTWTGSTQDARDLDALRRLQASDVPLFYLPAKAAKAARRLIAYHRTRELSIAEAGATRPAARRDLETVRAALAEAETGLDEYQSKQVLAAYGITGVAEQFCKNREDAAKAAEAIGYPVVLKIVSADISHKTEAGGVRLGIKDAEGLEQAYDAIMASAKSYAPKAIIPGVLVQRMRSGGIELIVGTSQDPQFGPVIMLGLGGILAEALKAATWRLCPVNRREAEEMIDEVRALPALLAGFRGSQKFDRKALAEALVAVSELASDARDAIESLDINPLAVFGEGQGTTALDALVVCRPRQTLHEKRKAD